MHISGFELASYLDVTSVYVGSSRVFADGLVHEKTVPEAVLVQTLAGRYEISRTDEEAMIDPGELFLVAADTPMRIVHRHGPDGRMAAQWIHFHCTLFKHREISQLLDMPLRVSGPPASDLGQIIGELLTLNQRPDAAANSLRQSLRSRELVSRMLRIVCDISELKAESEAMLLHSERMAPVLEHIFHRMSEPIQVEDLAAKAYMSQSHFHALFRAQFGYPPMEYVRRRRIGEACRLLINTDRSVAQIADMTGFSNPYHFCRAFKSIQGVPPTLYRKTNSLPLL